LNGLPGRAGCSYRDLASGELRDGDVVPTYLRISLPAQDASTRFSLAFKRLRMPSLGGDNIPAGNAHLRSDSEEKFRDSARMAPCGPWRGQPEGDSRPGLAATLKLGMRGVAAWPTRTHPGHLSKAESPVPRLTRGKGFGRVGIERTSQGFSGATALALDSGDEHNPRSSAASAR